MFDIEDIMLQKTGISGLHVHDILICQETDVGKNKPSGIATSTSKQDIKLQTIFKSRNFVLNFVRLLVDESYLPHSKQQVWDGNKQSTKTHVQLCENIMEINNVPIRKNLKVLSKKRVIMKKPSKKHLKTESSITKASYLKRRKSSCVHLVMTCFTLWTLIGCISCTESNVTWNLKTKPAIFGDDVKLECVISNQEHSCEDYIRQWYGGVYYGLLCEDGMCRNELKYEELDVSSCIYHLVIHNFTEQDLNQNYTCSYGIFNQRKGLTLNDGPFELQPSNESIHKTIKISDNSISVHLELTKVYPMPSCTLSYQDANTTEYVHKSVEMVGSFFKVNFNYTINEKCEGKIVISCTIGSQRMNISQNCPVSGGDRQIKQFVMIIVGIVACAGAMVFVFAAASCFVFFGRHEDRGVRSKGHKHVPVHSSCV